MKLKLVDSLIIAVLRVKLRGTLRLNFFTAESRKEGAKRCSELVELYRRD